MRYLPAHWIEKLAFFPVESSDCDCENKLLLSIWGDF